NIKIDTSTKRSDVRFYYEQRKEAFAKFGLHLHIRAAKTEEGIRFFKQHCQDKDDPEIPVFIMINILKGYKLSEYCLRELEAAKAKGIDLRTQLVDLYNSLKSNKK